MVNMAVQYNGPDPSLITLTTELRGHYGQPARPYEYVTGYKSADNFSGHNPDSNGIVHAVDIFTDDNGNIPQAEGRALAERLRLVGKATGRFSYLIHDMSPGAPQPMIAGKHTNWEWVPYTGADMHSDHIHVSIADLYWGDPCPVPASITNNTTRWGVTDCTVKPQGSTVTPITGGLTMADIDKIMRELSNIKSVLIASYVIDGETERRAGIQPIVVQNQARINLARAELAGLRGVVDQLAAKQGVAIDYGKVEAAVKKALQDGTVTVDVTVAGGK